MARLGIVQSSKRVRDRRAVKDLIGHVGGDIELLELHQTKGHIEEQILQFLSGKDAVLFILLNENATLHFVAGIAVGLGKKIGYLCDSSIYLPFSSRERPYSIIHGSEDLEFAIVSVVQKIIDREEAPRLISNLQRAGQAAIEERRKLALFPSADRPFRDQPPIKSLAKQGIDQSEDYSEGTEFDWTRRLAEALAANESISASLNLETDRNDGFDIILWNSDPDNALALFENPIAVEVKTSVKLDSKHVTKTIKMAQKQNIRSVILVTKAHVPPSQRVEFAGRARRRGVTLGFIDAVRNEAIDSREALLERLSNGSMGV